MSQVVHPTKKIYRKINFSDDEIIEEKAIVCPSCNKVLLSHDLKANNMICPECKNHFNITARDRINLLCDDNTFADFNSELTSGDPLSFDGYKEKIEKDKNSTGLNEAIITGKAMINGMPCVIAAMESNFRMGSMGTVVGEKIYLAAEAACKEHIPFIIITASGGARMQEGMLSLMQMAKTTLAFHMLSQAGVMSIVILTSPTTGGVTASFATLGDILIAEPGALIGFAGKKVISETINKGLPDDFQTAEFLLEHGHIDDIVCRQIQRNYLSNILGKFKNNQTFYKECEFTQQINDKYHEYKQSLKATSPLEPIDILKIVRKDNRPKTSDYIKYIFEDFIELHGDRYIDDDGAIIGGVATFHGMPVTVIGHQRGIDIEENLKRNFGMPKPAGFKKVERLIEQSNKFNRPIITFVDTKGADPNAESEELNQSSAISHCLMSMMGAKVPVISIVIGEGGSGGALAIGIGNAILMMENSVFSVISPEGAAQILWKNRSMVKEAIENLKVTSRDLYKLNIIDDIIPEILPDASEDIKKQSEIIDVYICKYFNELSKLTEKELISQRAKKYRSIGI